jgi:predicted DNA binding CopG/RHH family protein
MKDRFTPKKPTVALDPADIIAQKQHSTKPLLPEPVDDGEKHRVSLNLPKDKYDTIKKKAKARGLTVTAYLIILINHDIESEV